MQRAGRDKNGQKEARTLAENTEQAAVYTPETHQHRKKVVGCLLQVYALQLMLFGLLAWFVHVHPILPLDVAITDSFQQNQAPWLRITMLAISYPGSSLLLPVLVLLTAVFFWVVGLRLEAVLVAGLSTISLLLNLLLKIQVSRPRPTANLVHIIQAAVGYSFPSGHVMAYIAYWGLLFYFRLHPLRRKALVAYRPPGDIGRVRRADRSFPCVPGRPLGQRCPGCLPHRRGLIRPFRRFLSTIKRARCVGEGRGTCLDERKECLKVISDQGMVLSWRNILERSFLVMRIITCRSAGKGNILHVPEYY